MLAFKGRVNELGIARADLLPYRVRVTWADGQKKVQPEAIVRLVMANRNRIHLQPPATLELSLAGEESLARRLDEAGALLGSLLNVNGAQALFSGVHEVLRPRQRCCRGLFAFAAVFCSLS